MALQKLESIISVYFFYNIYSKIFQRMEIKTYHRYLTEGISNEQIMERFLNLIETGEIACSPHGKNTLSVSPTNGKIIVDSPILINLDKDSISDLGIEFEAIYGTLEIHPKGQKSLLSTSGFPRFCGKLVIHYPDFGAMGGETEICHTLEIENGNLRTLKGLPKIKGGDLIIDSCLLRNLNNGPFLISGNINIRYNPGLKPDEIMEFKDMHNYIRLKYNSKSREKLLEMINLDKEEYVWYILLKNPSWIKFLDNFSENIKDKEYLTRIQGFGLI